MRKWLFIFVCLAVSTIFLCGCANTFKGIGDDIKHNWEVLKKWDKKMQENWW